MAPLAWGFDINNAVDFQSVLPDVPAWQDAAERLLFQENYDEAAKETQKHLSAAKGSKDGLGEAMALLMLARVRSTQNVYEEAKASAQEALEKFRSLASAKGIAAASLTLAKMAVDTRERPEAERLCEEALQKFQAANCKVGEGAVHHLLSRMHIRDNEVEESLDEADKAQALFEKAGDKEGQAAVLLVKGNIYSWNYRDAQDEASKCGKEATAICRKLSRACCRHREGVALFLQAAACFQMQRFKDGLKAAKESVELFKDYGGPRTQASAMRAVTMGLMQSGALDNASENSAETVEMLRNSCNDQTLLAEALAVDALVARQRVVKGEVDEASAMVKKAQEVFDIFATLDDEHATALHRLELAQALLLSGDSAAALTEAKMSLEFFKGQNKEIQGMCMLTIAQCQHNVGDSAAGLATASKAQDMFDDPAMASQASELVDFLKAQSGTATGPKWVSNTSWGTYDVPKTVPPPSDPTQPGIKRSLYSDLIKTRIHTGDTPEAISFEWQGILYMDQFLGVDFPFIRDVPPPPAAFGMAPPPPKPAAAPVAPKTKPSGPSSGGPSLERSVPRPEKPTGPVVIKPAVVGNDILGGRYRDCPDDVHDRMVALARAGCIPTTTLSQRSVLERKKPTFHGHADWRDAARWGYIHPTITAPRGCKWQRASVGWKLIGPAPGELIANEDSAVSAPLQKSPSPPLRSTTSKDAGRSAFAGHMTVETLLRGARPDWTPAEVDAARRKLEAAHIKFGHALVRALMSHGSDGDLNSKLERAGQEAFDTETVQALRAFAASQANAEPWLGPAAANFAAAPDKLPRAVGFAH